MIRRLIKIDTRAELEILRGGGKSFAMEPLVLVETLREVYTGAPLTQKLWILYAWLSGFRLNVGRLAA